VEDVLRVVSKLCYSQHEGSGFNFSRADVLAMTPREWRFHLEWLDETRRVESEAIRQAYRTK